MILGDLIIAMDFSRKGKEPHTQRSYRKKGIWYVLKTGPTYSQTFKITWYNSAGEAWLLANEVNQDGSPIVRPDHPKQGD